MRNVDLSKLELTLWLSFAYLFSICDFVLLNIDIMIISENLYLYGGWDGNQDLADLWCYNSPNRQWTCLSRNAAEEVVILS